MFMLAPWYSLLVVARVVQGMCSTIVWVVGLALLSETCPSNQVGQQMGLAMSGLPIGAILAPPIGGVLYEQLGFHAPFVFSLSLLVFDMIGRILVIEHKQALKWSLDPIPLSETTQAINPKKPVWGTESETSNLNSRGM
jgi:MFS transporter, DHA1 family, solute carrier family 18 (vesicular amine transporter), member 1/2